MNSYDGWTPDIERWRRWHTERLCRHWRIRFELAYREYYAQFRSVR